MAKYHLGVVNSLLWSGLILVRSGHHIDAGLFFLFAPNKTFITNHAPRYSPYELWAMNDAVWAIVGLAAFSTLLIVCVIRIIRNRDAKIAGQ